MEKTSYELWFERILNVSYLRTFGCLTYYHAPKNKRNKLQPSGKRSIMVGYSCEKVGCRLFVLERNIIIEERSVIFNENVKGSHQKSNRDYRELWDIEDILKISTNNHRNSSNGTNESDRQSETEEEISDGAPGEERELRPDKINEDRNEYRGKNIRNRGGRPKELT
ncbi:hypothetical protein KM043_004798 [Ampulex compressa]|nr:hypothetical protein KM043_004798 [Ampulex compressa]